MKNIQMLKAEIDKVLPAPWTSTVYWGNNIDPDGDRIICCDGTDNKCNGPCGSMGIIAIEIDSFNKIKYGFRLRNKYRKRNVTLANCEFFADVIAKQAQHLNQYIADSKYQRNREVGKC